MPELPTGIIAFLMTDVEGSTRLWEEWPDAMRESLRRHDLLADRIVAAQGGTLLKKRGEGDSLFAVFPSAAGAVRAALALQQAFRLESWPVPLWVRCAVHAGEADLRDGDYTGLTVNRCARLRAIASGGQSLLLEAAAVLAQDALPEGASLQDMGLHRLRDLRRPERVYALRHPALPEEFPPLRSVDSLPNNLPRQSTSFVGRERELAEIARLLSRYRLLTIIGTGGAGKTRLALQAAAEMLEGYPQGLWLMEFGQVAEPERVPSVLLTAMRLREEPGRTPLQTLLAAVDRKAILMVLDNCEHLIQACAEVTDALVRACPNVRVLATSREALRITGERVFPLGALSLPQIGRGATPESQAQAESVRLFAERAASSRPGFVLTPANLPVVASLCRRVDGLPLTIELTAARLAEMSLRTLQARLRRHFRLLSPDGAADPARQQTLQAVIDWSYCLLAPDEARLFARLSLFSGGWTVEAAEEVCRESGADALLLLIELVRKSLVVAEERSGEMRYRLLETIRHFAADRLAEHADREFWRARHRDFYLALAEDAEPHLRGPDQIVWLDQLETEHGNLAEALAASAGGPEQLRLAAALNRFWFVRGHWKQGRRWLEDALAVNPMADNVSRANALLRTGNMAYAEMDYPAAKDYYQQSLHLYEQQGNQVGISQALSNLGMVAEEEGEYGQAQAFLEQSLSIRRNLEQKNEIAIALNSLGGVLSRLLLTAAARTALEESLALYRESGNSGGIAMALYNLGMVDLAEDRPADALARFREKLVLERQVARKQGIYLALQGIAMAWSAQGRHSEAAQAFDESERYFAAHREMIRVVAASMEDYARALAATRAALAQGATDNP